MEISAINSRYNVVTKSQYDNYPATTAQSYPMYVEEEVEKPKSGFGMLALGILGIAGIGYGIYKHTNSKAVVESLEKTKASLEEATTKITELESKVTTTEEALKTANDELEKLKAKKLGIGERFKNWWNTKFPKKTNKP